MNFRTTQFLEAHIKKTLSFYAPNCVDERGGFNHFFKDNGEVYDANTRHLVSSTRFVFNYAMAYDYFKEPADLDKVRHGIDYLETVHRQENGGYAWLLENGNVVDGTNHCYGLAFVLLAHASALKVGLSESKSVIERVWQLLEEKYFEPEFGLYKDEFDADFNQADKYRGQNANMHTCEALIACFEATQDEKFLQRAYKLADNMVNRQAAKAEGLIWEHYDSQWQVDLEYNKDDPKHLFRPWGFQPGHQTEWSKLLLLINRYMPKPWLVEKAVHLFDESLKAAWDSEFGGICYGFAPDKSICDDDKYFWVQAESFAAAALLALETGDESYWQWYDRIWQYAWDNFVDHEYGAWYRILNNKNEKYSDEKSPAGKTDYHTMGACYEVLRSMKLKGE
ncbi:AGE family epimerase/isomerase [Pseudoalteromonas sp. A757]|uniref:AGE family epimerase/isomerase n=1 Tax=Pseudoalteromonas sp. A757 TaxID=2250709 RepID=UPI000FFE857D|nr:AGE family epimerase/isomerase [Pseudoalteromonas sp. A757]RXE86489.1 AGE family epimerase/isomerase [Pseudoalteromonas sp. A757]